MDEWNYGVVVARGLLSVKGGKLHPQTFLKTFWRMELRPQVFVAMSFDPKYQDRFDHVIDPAIRSIVADGQKLEPYRIDISKSGDSILTEISDGIAHAQLVLADVSTVGKDSVSGRSYRNGNVMYEVGLALACRHSSEVLLVRDDRDDFLFDVSTIPHKSINFANTAKAKEDLRSELLARLQEQKFHQDVRVRLAIASLSAEEVLLLKKTKKYDMGMIWGDKVKGISNWYSIAIGRLLDKGVILFAGCEIDIEKPAFRFTPLGYVVSQIVNSRLPQFQDPTKEATPEEANSAI